MQQATVQLAQDQYGNYVIQHVVEQGRPHERNQVRGRNAARRARACRAPNHGWLRRSGPAAPHAPCTRPRCPRLR
jgi:hypothetical protein